MSESDFQVYFFLSFCLNSDTNNSKTEGSRKFNMVLKYLYFENEEMIGNFRENQKKSLYGNF